MTPKGVRVGNTEATHARRLETRHHKAGLAIPSGLVATLGPNLAF
jgi:hypothetical protein